VDFVLKRIWGIMPSGSSARYVASESRTGGVPVLSPAAPGNGRERISQNAPARGPNAPAKAQRRPGTIAQP
jgi:hypothetical protein